MSSNFLLILLSLIQDFQGQRWNRDGNWANVFQATETESFLVPSGGKETNYQSGRAASVELNFKIRYQYCSL